MYRRARFSLFLLAALACATAAPSRAQEPYPRGAYGSQVLPLDRILPAIRSGRPGQFYDAEGPFPDAYGGYHYRIKWLTPEGRVIWLDTDARSGRVLGVARGDWRDRGPPAFAPGGLPGDRFVAPPLGGPYGRPPPGGPFGRPPGRGGFGEGWHGGGRRGRGH